MDEIEPSEVLVTSGDHLVTFKSSVTDNRMWEIVPDN
jgi:hypothetical protein